MSNSYDEMKKQFEAIKKLIGESDIEIDIAAKAPRVDRSPIPGLEVPNPNLQFIDYLDLLRK